MKKIVLGLIVGILVLSGCAARPNPVSYEQAAYAGAICSDRNWNRVPDEWCPIGDEPVVGYDYAWRYRPYNDYDHDIDVVYVGYPIDRTTWYDRRPPRVTTLNIDRGSFPTAVPRGVSSSNSARVLTATEIKREEADPAKRPSSSVQRGGLGSPSGRTVGAGNSAGKKQNVGSGPTGARPLSKPKGK